MKIIVSVATAMMPSMHGEDQPLGEHVADRLDGGEAGQDVADVALLEEAQRQANQ